MRRREFSGRQANQHASPAPARHTNALFECAQRGCRDHNAMCSAAGCLLHSLEGVASLCIDDEIGTELPGMGELRTIIGQRGRMKASILWSSSGERVFVFI